MTVSKCDGITDLIQLFSGGVGLDRELELRMDRGHTSVNWLRLTFSLVKFFSNLKREGCGSHLGQGILFKFNVVIREKFRLLLGKVVAVIVTLNEPLVILHLDSSLGQTLFPFAFHGIHPADAHHLQPLVSEARS